MGRVIAGIGAIVMVGALSGAGIVAAREASAAPQRTGDRVTDQQTIDKSQCRIELERLKNKLRQLQAELKEHEQALRRARAAGNREKAEQEMQAIRRIKAEIQDTQEKIRRLSRACGR